MALEDVVVDLFLKGGRREPLDVVSLRDELIQDLALEPPKNERREQPADLCGVRRRVEKVRKRDFDR